jgi:hypothetical protein
VLRDIEIAHAKREVDGIDVAEVCWKQDDMGR